MTGIFVKTFFEFLAVVLLIYGFVHEKDLIRFEQKLGRQIRRAYRKAKIKVARALYNFLCKFDKSESK